MKPIKPIKPIKPKKTKKPKKLAGLKVSQSNKQIVSVVVNNILKAKKRGKPRAKNKPIQNTIDAQVDRTIDTYAKFLRYSQLELQSKELQRLKNDIKSLDDKKKSMVLEALHEDIVPKIENQPIKITPSNDYLKQRGLQIVEEQQRRNKELEEKIKSSKEKIEGLDKKLKLGKDLRKVDKMPISKDLREYIMKPYVKSSSSMSGLGKLEAHIYSGTGLYDTEINNIMKYEPNWCGVIPSDKFHTLHAKTDMNFVINTDPASKPGKHWVSCRFDSKNKSVEYYDSFGKPASPAIDKGIRSLFDRINPEPEDMYQYKYNGKVNQDATTSTCGYFACLFLLSRNDGMTFKQSTDFDEDDVNDKRQSGEFKFI